MENKHRAQRADTTRHLQTEEVEQPLALRFPHTDVTLIGSKVDMERGEEERGSERESRVCECVSERDTQEQQ